MSRPAYRTIAPPEPDLTPAEMVRRARDLAPYLRERSLAMEQERRISDEVNERIRELGIYRILQPRRFGGYEFDLRTFADVMIELTRADGSTGWVTCFNTAHCWWAAQMPEEGQVELFGADGDLRAPIMLGPTGMAKPVDGGYLLDGRWDYASGCDIANWLGMLARVPGDGPGAPPADVIIAMVPRREYRIHDNWHVLGLRATGSKQAVVESVFVPHHRAVSFYEMMRKFTAPGHGVHRNPLYRLPLLPIVLVEAGAVVVGLAQAALDALVEYAEHKRLSFPPFTPLKDTRRVQAAVGRASGRLEAARAGLLEIIRRQEARAERLDRGPAFTDAEMRRDHILMLEVMRLGHECVDIAFVTAGSSAARTPSVLERVFRDMAMMRTHYFVDAERVGENVGAIMFGLPPYTDY